MNTLIQRTLALLVAAFCAAIPANAEIVCDTDSDIGQELRLPVRKWSDTTNSERGVILALHGATLHGGRFDPAARDLVRQGYIVYAPDYRGFGRWREEEPQFADGTRSINYAKTKSDLVSILSKIRSKYPNTPVYCMGESLGANLAMWIASEHSRLTDGVIAVSPCVKTYLHPTPLFALGFVKGLVNINKELKLEPFLKPYLSDDPEATAEYIADPSVAHTMSGKDVLKCLMTNARSIAKAKAIPAQMPVLLVAGKLDKVYRASAVAPFAKRIGSKQQTVDIIPDRGHLLVESPRLEPRVLAAIDTWLQSHDKLANNKTFPATTADARLGPNKVATN